MKIGLKYCGGCNPNYERGQVVARARAEYPAVQFESYDPDATYMVVLVICGCLEECFSFQCQNSHFGVILIRSEKEYRFFQEFMQDRCTRHSGKLPGV